MLYEIVMLYPFGRRRWVSNFVCGESKRKARLVVDTSYLNILISVEAILPALK